MSTPQVILNNSGNKPVNIDQFILATKPTTKQVQGTIPLSDGNSFSFELPKVGLGLNLYLSIQGTVTVAGTVSGGTFQRYPNPAPFGVVRSVKFGAGAAQFRQHSLWSLYKHGRYRESLDPLSTGSDQLYCVQSQGASGQYGSLIVPGANVAAGTYAVKFQFKIPLAYNNTGEVAQLLLATPASYFLTLDTGNLTSGISATGGSNDLFNGLVGTGLTVTSNIEASLGLEYYQIPNGIDIAPFIQSALVVKDTQAPLIAGQNVINLTNTNLYTMLITEAYSGGYALGNSDLLSVAMQYGGGQLVYSEPILFNQNRNYYLHRGTHNLDGTGVFDMGLRRGVTERRDVLEGFNDASITDLQVQVTTSGSLVPSNPSGITVTTESLQNLVAS